MDPAPQDLDVVTLSIADLVCTTLAETCNLERDEVSPDTQVLDLDIDSLTLVSVVAQIEAVYGVELQPDDTLAIIEAVLVSDIVTRISAVVTQAELTTR